MFMRFTSSLIRFVNGFAQEEGLRFWTACITSCQCKKKKFLLSLVLLFCSFFKHLTLVLKKCLIIFHTLDPVHLALYVFGSPEINPSTTTTFQQHRLYKQYIFQAFYQNHD